MLDKLTHVPILVNDQDKALAFYVDKLGFEKRQDHSNKSARWLTVAPPGAAVEFALVKGEYLVDPRANESVQFTLATPDCRAEAAKLKARGVAVGEPAEMPFGVLAKFLDPDGNRFALLQPAEAR
ncbi:MAG TPA: VOC family protein [Candidatus Thermoplasmatota archaeon]|nr:VOC family protein [Candidatus Thermoplasmatota archaeon]